MNDAQKQPQKKAGSTRLLGMAALLALAVLILPLVFDGDPDEYERLLRPVPRVPVITVPEVDVEQLQRDMQALEQEALAGMPVMVPDDPASAPDRQALDANGLPVSWVLQVASFAREENAFRLIKQLRDAGYTAFTRQVAGESGPDDDRVRVMVGPGLARDGLMTIASEIEEQFQLEGISMMRYRIEDDRNLIGG